MKNNKNITTGAIIILLAVLSMISASCEKYPSFPNELKAYYPYKKNQTIYFHNENNDIMELHVSKVAFTKCHFGYKCTDITTMRISATAKYTITGTENTYKVDGGIDVDGLSVKVSFCAPVTINYSANYDSWSIYSIDPYTSGVSSIIGDTIKMGKGTIIVRNVGIIQFKDENYTWTLGI